MDDDTSNLQKQVQEKQSSFVNTAKSIDALGKIVGDVLERVELLGEISRLERQVVFWRTLSIMCIILFILLIILGLYG